MTASEIKNTLRQMLADWDAATDQQRADALAAAADAATEADRRGIALLRPELDPPADRSAGSYLPGERSALELSQAYAAAIDEADAKRERASDLIHDGRGLRARGGLVYFG